MSGKESPQSVIDSYRKRQKLMPFLVGGLAVLLVTVGIIILIIWLTGSGGPGISLFATKTPTPTNTATPTPVTPTSTTTNTPTETLTPTITETPTPSGPQEYTIQENDNCWEIAQKFQVDFGVLLAINNFGGGCPINPGDKILIPAPGQELPTETPIPTDLVRGTKLDYTVKLGDTLDTIATKFLTTRENIMRDNKITDPNQLFAGQVLKVTYGLVTLTPTPSVTNTPAPTLAVTTAPTSAASATLGVATLRPTATATK